MTTKEYLRDPALSGEMRVTAIDQTDRPIVRVEKTWFHAQGGGQKADRGTIGPAEIYNVRHGPAGEVDHYVASVDGLELGAVYPFLIDPEWRLINANHHTAGHLISALAEEMAPGVKAVNGHHWPSEARVDFAGEGLERLVLESDALELRLAEAIRHALPVRVVGDPFRSRAIQIADYPAIPCGGVHASILSELGPVKIRSVKIKSGMARVSYDLVSTV